MFYLTVTFVESKIRTNNLFDSAVMASNYAVRISLTMKLLYRESF